jgi:hypothetical protein
MPLAPRAKGANNARVRQNRATDRMSTDINTSSDAIRPASASLNSDLPLFRFRLRQLLAFVTLICLLMAAMVTWNGLTALVLLLATLVVSLHLFSTALGTQLRWHANRTRSQHSATHACETTADRTPASFGPRSRSPWHERRSTPLPWLLRWITGASLIGAILGALLLGGTIGHHSSWAGIAVGSFSLGVVAGWFAFVGYSFYGVFRHGLRDAMAEDRRDQPR